LCRKKKVPKFEKSNLKNNNSKSNNTLKSKL